MPKTIICLLVVTTTLFAQKVDYRVLSTSKTSSMQKEMNEAAEAGYAFSQVMGGDTAIGGKEVVVVMAKATSGAGKHNYKLLCTSKTSTIQKEMQQAGEEGFEHKGQTVFESAFGGAEVCVIMDRDSASPAKRITYRVLATKKTSTMQKELIEAGAEGFSLTGTTVAKTSFGGSEIVSILKKAD
jgi:hypothetical protein